MIRILILFILGACRVYPAGLPIAKPKQHTLSVCAIFRNEAPYLKEWIEYHRLVGVDHFYLYNNGSLDPFRKILTPYIAQKIVTLVQWPDFLGPQARKFLGESAWPLSTQISAYENAIKWTALGKTKWLVFLDVDEFLVPTGGDKVTEILEEYDQYPGVVLLSEYYDASYKGTLPQRKLVVEAVELTTAPKKNLFRSVQKTILKPESCTSFSWPPYQCNFKNAERAVRVKKELLRIHFYTNRMQFRNAAAVKERLPVDSKFLSEKEKREYLRAGFEVEDAAAPTSRYVPALYKRLGLN